MKIYLPLTHLYFTVIFTVTPITYIFSWTFLWLHKLHFLWTPLNSYCLEYEDTYFLLHIYYFFKLNRVKWPWHSSLAFLVSWNIAKKTSVKAVIYLKWKLIYLFRTLFTFSKNASFRKYFNIWCFLWVMVKLDDIQAHTSDILMTYEYIRVTYGWHTNTYK